MVTRHYIKPLSRFKTHWSMWPGSPCQEASHTVYGLTVTFALTFHPDLNEAQRLDVIRFFQETARNQDKQVLRARFVGLFARRSLTALEYGVAA